MVLKAWHEGLGYRDMGYSAYVAAAYFTAKSCGTNCDSEVLNMVSFLVSQHISHQYGKELKQLGCTTQCGD